MSGIATAINARCAYDTLAAHYDYLTAGHNYELWLSRLHDLALCKGLRGRRLLDVACGTGRSFEPLMARGFDVTACDVSPAMVARAAERLPDGKRDRVHVADMRNLPDLGEFDLVTCLDDAVNYLLDQEDLSAAFASVSRNLAPGGVYVFDVNSLKTYRTMFGGTCGYEVSDVRFTLFGLSSADVAAGSICSARIEVEEAGLPKALSCHTQRHWKIDQVREQLSRAGFGAISVYGQQTGVRLSPHADEERDTKIVFLAVKI